MSNELLVKVKERAQQWLGSNYDEATRNEVRKLIEGPENDLIDAFYTNLEFGTGGLRGIMGAGTNRINIYTVAMATQGLCNYLKKIFSDVKELKAAVAYDSRNNSKLYAEKTAQVFAGNGFKVFLCEDIRPTPYLSFAIRQLGCQSGVVITASHNPKEYNGYKAYWDDGAQVLEPHDKNIVDEVQKIKSIDDVKSSNDERLISYVGKSLDEAYLKVVSSLSLAPEIIKKQHDLKIVYTALHGTGITLIPQAFKDYGFTNVSIVPQQDIPDGNFPTLKSPNPEDPAAFDLAIQLARKVDADVVLGTDPDADRVGVAVKNDKGDFILLNGNQTGAILVYYLLNQWKSKGKLKGNEYVVKTIVTTELIADICKKADVKYFDVLTGFKYIAEMIRLNEGKLNFIGGGEESYGYLVGEFVRDKDAVVASAIIAETAAWAKENGKSMYDLLLDIYVEFGMYKESLLNITKKGKTGQEEIQQMMEAYRSTPPSVINGAEVMIIHDYQKQKSIDMISDLRYDINLPKSNVLQFILKDGTKISIRPSGTEPKIKFYFSVCEALKSHGDYDKINSLLNIRIQDMINDMNLK